MDFRILGPLEVIGDDGPLALGGAKQRALLALLLLHEGETVSTDRLVDELWGETPPATATKSVQVYVSHLRRAMGNGHLETQGHGYRLRTNGDEFDLVHFRRLTGEGRTLLADGETRRAADMLRKGLALWRGPPLADLSFEPFAQERLGELDELHTAAIEDRLEADLAQGRHAELVAELQELVRAHPLRERLRGQLMLALYRSGRQAEALECFQEGRRRLLDELGLEPGHALQQLEREILNQDPGLAGPPTLRPRLAPSGLRSRGRLLIAAGCLLAAAAIAAVLVATLRGSDSPARAVLGPDAVGAVDPSTGNVSSAVRVPGGPARLASGGSRLWVGSDRSRTVSAVDTRNGNVVDVVAPGAYPTDLALGEGALWVLDRDRGVVVQIDPAYAEVKRRIPLGVEGQPALHDRNIADPWAIAAGAGGVWVTDGSPRLRRLDPASLGRSRAIDTGSPLGGVLATPRALWAISGPRAEVLRLDPRSGRVLLRIPIVSRPGFASPYPIAIEQGFGSLWVLNANTGTVSRVDPSMRGVTATIPIGQEHGPVRLATGRGRVWVASSDGTLTAIDPAANRVSHTQVAHGLNDVAVSGGRAWVTAANGSGIASSPAVGTGPGATTALAPTTCSPVYHRSGVSPQYLVAADMPLQGQQGAVGAQVAAATQLMMREHRFQAGRFPLGFQVCDATTAAQTAQGADRCQSNGRAYAADPSVIAVIGPFLSGCAAEQVPITNRAPHGPLAQVSPSNTFTGLTLPLASPLHPPFPQRNFPTGTRSYARVIAPDDAQGIVDAIEARRLGVKRAVVVDDAEAYGSYLAGVFRRVASRQGMRIVGSMHVPLFAPAAAGRRAAHDLLRTRPDGVYVAGYYSVSALAFIREARRLLGPRLQFVVPDGYLDELAGRLGPVAEGIAVTVPGRPVEALGPRGRAFADRLEAATGTRPSAFAIYGGAATELVLDAIARSDGTRASVVRALFHSHLRNSILGDYRITPTGDTSATDVAVYRIRNGRQRLDRVLTPPADLLAQIRSASARQR